MTKQQTVQVQTLLSGLGLYKGNIDGIAGPMTISAVRLYQRANGLTEDGIVGPKTLASMFPNEEPAPSLDLPRFYLGDAKALEPGDLDRIANDIGVESRMLKAIVRVEAAGKAFDDQKRVTVLYEPHIAYRMAANTAERSRLVTARLAYKTWGTFSYPRTSDARYAQIDQASKIASEELAADASSWGMGQIMGFNAQAVGYMNAVDMVRSFAKDAENQTAAIGAFILNNASLFHAVQRRDFDAIAENYNGAAYRKNNYQGKLKAAYEAEK